MNRGPVCVTNNAWFCVASMQTLRLVRQVDGLDQQRQVVGDVEAGVDDRAARKPRRTRGLADPCRRIFRPGTHRASCTPRAPTTCPSRRRPRSWPSRRALRLRTARRDHGCRRPGSNRPSCSSPRRQSRCRQTCAGCASSHPSSLALRWLAGTVIAKVAMSSPGMPGDDARAVAVRIHTRRRHARIAGVVVEDVVANAGQVRGRTTVGHRFVEVRALPRMRQIERRLRDGGDADIVVDVLLEVAHRQVAAFGVVPLERQIVVLRFERLAGPDCPADPCRR